MTYRHTALTALGCALAIGLYAVVPAASMREAASTPLTLGATRVTLSGTSNIHEYTASTTTARLVRLELANGVLGAAGCEEVLKPGAIEAFEIAIPAATLTSPREGLDKNMHKALKVTEHPDITFRLSRFEGANPAGAVRGVGTLTVAGVQREVALALKVQRHDATFTVSGEVTLLMTDFGIAPPKAMLGMLKTDPKVTVTFETVLGVPLT
jgi:polyisoprenoid-binding protein YceI